MLSTHIYPTHWIGGVNGSVSAKADMHYCWLGQLEQGYFDWQEGWPILQNKHHPEHRWIVGNLPTCDETILMDVEKMLKAQCANVGCCNMIST